MWNWNISQYSWWVWKDSNGEGVQQFLISAQKTCPHLNLPFCSGHVNHNSSLIFLYIFIYLLYEICFLKLEKEKRPKVFEEWGLLTSPKVAVCLRVQQKKVSGVLSQVSLYSLFIYLLHCAPPTLSFIQNWSPLHPDLFWSVFPREVERGGAAVERRVGGEGGRVISSVYGVVSWRHPVTPACSGLTSPHVWTVLQTEGKQIRRWGFVL